MYITCSCMKVYSHHAASWIWEITLVKDFNYADSYKIIPEILPGIQWISLPALVNETLPMSLL